jgi:hypothetical protein
VFSETIQDGVAHLKNTSNRLGKRTANFFIKWDNGNRNLLNKIGSHYQPVEEFKPSNAPQQKGMGAGEGAASLGLPIGGARGGTEPLPNEAIVVRGGIPTPEQLTKDGESIAPEVKLSGVSVQSAKGATVEQFSRHSK